MGRSVSHFRQALCPAQRSGSGRRTRRVGDTGRQEQRIDDPEQASASSLNSADPLDFHLRTSDKSVANQFSALSRETPVTIHSVSSHTFAVAVRVKHSNHRPDTLSHAEPELRLPRLRPCEIAAAAGVDAVSRALEEMLVEKRPAT